MAIVQNPITGRSKGKFGNAVFSKWKDKNTLRSKALEVHNPRTVGQVLTRSKLAVAVSTGRGVLDILRAGFKEFAGSQSEWNEFIKLAMADIHVVAGVPSLLTSLGLKFSKGSLAPVTGAALGSLTSSTAAATWTNNTNGSTGLGTDQYKLIAVDTDNAISYESSTSKTRADASGTFTFPVSDISTGNYNFFMVALRPSEGKAGDSMNVN